MEEDHDWRIGALRLVDIDMFDLGWPVRHPHWFSDDQPCDLIVRCLALKNVFGVECINVVIIGLIDILLVHIHPHQRAFDAGWWYRRASLSGSRMGRNRKSARHCAGHESASRKIGTE